MIDEHLYLVSNYITTQNPVPASYISETIYILYPLHTCNSLVKKETAQIISLKK